MGRIIGRYHIKSAVIVSYRGCENAARAVDLFEHYLTFSGKDVTYLLPVHKVVALEKRHSGEILERA